LREHLHGEADRLDPEVGLTRTVQLDRQRRPIVPRIAASEVPASVAEAVRLVMDEMPERSVLEARRRDRDPVCEFSVKLSPVVEHVAGLQMRGGRYGGLDVFDVVDGRAIRRHAGGFGRAGRCGVKRRGGDHGSESEAAAVCLVLH
jgi:hypothetical protein